MPLNLRAGAIVLCDIVIPEGERLSVMDFLGAVQYDQKRDNENNPSGNSVGTDQNMKRQSQPIYHHYRTPCFLIRPHTPINKEKVSFPNSKAGIILQWASHNEASG